VNRDAQDNLLMLVGATMLAVGVSDLHLRYVKPAMQPLVVLSGVVLLALGLRGGLRVYREVTAGRHVGRDAAAAPHAAEGGEGVGHRDHDHHGLTRTAWLLLLPLLVLCFVAPPTLGSFAAARSDTTIPEPSLDLGPLPQPRDGAVDLSLTAYYSRVLYDRRSVQGIDIRLTGFVTPVDGRWFVTRMVLACCAADGRPVKVLVTGTAGSAPPADTWVEVVGRFTAPQTLPGAEVSVATIAVDRVRVVDQPRNAYE
jgi:uncharacterized repeat protein (TIGR03943 family)